MPVQFTCPHCGQRLSADASKAGTTSKCPHCEKPVIVPAAAPPPPRPVPPQSKTPMPPGGPPPIPPQIRTPVPPGGPPPAPPGAPPPMPPRPGAPRPPASTESILEGYRSAGGPAGPGWKARLKQLFGATKDRARAVKMKHDIKSLRTAQEQQLESLGLLTLERRPAQVDMADELAELSRVQSKLAEKQTTLSSLQQTPGSGAVVKQLKQEEAGLRARQRELMIAIGRKADQARPEMAGATGHYGALDQLQTTLQAKETELARLEEQLGPVWEGGGPSLASVKKPLLIGGGVVVGLIVLWLTIRLFIGGDLPRWTKRYIPDGAWAVGYVDAEAILDSDLWSELDKDKDWRKEMEEEFKDATGGELEDVKELLIVFASKTPEPSWVVARTSLDTDPEDLGPKDQDLKRKTKEYKDVEYVVVFSTVWGNTEQVEVCIAMPKEGTYIMSHTEDDMKEAIKCYDANEAPEFDKELQQTLDKVAGHDVYFAGALSKLRAANPMVAMVAKETGAEAFGFGLSLNSSMKAAVAVVLNSENEAKKNEEKLNKALKNSIEDVEDLLDDASGTGKEITQLCLDVLESMSFSRSGALVQGRAKCKTADIVEVINMEVEEEREAERAFEEVVTEVAKSFQKEFD